MAGVNSDVIAFGTIQHGRLLIHDRRAFDQAIRRFRDDTAVQIEVTKRQATRSLQANRFWWGCCLKAAADHTGYTADEMHEIAKQMFLPKKLAVCDGNGEIVGEFVMGGSTRNLTVEEFMEFVEKFRRWCAETLQVYIPDPQEAGYGAGV